jgi:hypothetical protein
MVIRDKRKFFSPRARNAVHVPVEEIPIPHVPGAYPQVRLRKETQFVFWNSFR